MKKQLVLLSCLAAFGAFAEATVSDVTLTQLWPFSTDLKVTYTLTGASAAAPVNVKLYFYNAGSAVTLSDGAHNAMKGDLAGLTTDGVKTVIVNPKKAFATTATDLPNLKVQVATEETTAEKANEVIYRIYKLKGVKKYSGEAPIEVTRSDLLNGKYGDYETDYSRIGKGFNTTLKDVLIWTGVTNGWTYKTDKLVMRKIPAAGVEWTMGSPVGETGRNYTGAERENQHTVRLTEDYFISVFEITQAQLTNLYDQVPAHFASYPDSPVRPFVGFSYDNVRGQTSWGTSSGSKDQRINWPTNSPQHTVYNARLAAFMRTYLRTDKTAAQTIFDLATEAQWEFACRAGATNALYSGKEILGVETCANLDELSWYSHSTFPDDTVQVMPVGTKKPNAFGLYDMLGNATEVCLDCYTADTALFYDADPETGVMGNVQHEGVLVDPVGPSSLIFSEPGKPDRTRRGGRICGDTGARYGRIAYRIGGWNWGQSGQAADNRCYDGLRLVCPAAANWAK